MRMCRDVTGWALISMKIACSLCWRWLYKWIVRSKVGRLPIWQIASLFFKLCLPLSPYNSFRWRHTRQQTKHSKSVIEQLQILLDLVQLLPQLASMTLPPRRQLIVGDSSMLERRHQKKKMATMAEWCILAFKFWLEIKNGLFKLFNVWFDTKGHFLYVFRNVIK